MFARWTLFNKSIIKKSLSKSSKLLNFRDKRKKSVTKAKDITRDRFGRSRVTGKGAKAVSATQKAGPFNEGGLMNKKGDK